MTNLNEDIVKSLPIPEAGNKVHYFPDAVLQGAKAPRGFGVRVTAGGVRSFVMNYRIGPIERRYTIGQHPDWSVLRAVKEARELRRRIDRGDDPLGDRRKQEAATKNTLKAICEEFFRRDGASLRTKEWRERALERLVYSDEIGGRGIEDIRRSDIIRLLDKIADERGLVMADRTLAIIRKVFNWHATRSDEFRSPIVRGMARTKPKERARDHTLTDDDLRAVWKVAGASTGPFGALVRFILLTRAPGAWKPLGWPGTSLMGPSGRCRPVATRPRSTSFAHSATKRTRLYPPRTASSYSLQTVKPRSVGSANSSERLTRHVALKAGRFTI
jgi:hypothetical protein